MNISKKPSRQRFVPFSVMSLLVCAVAVGTWASSYGGLATDSDLLHQSPKISAQAREITIPDTYAPFGNRTDTDRVGEDGSVAVRDANGAIIWVNRLGQSTLLPESSLAKTLYVSNSECVVWRNRFAGDYNARGSVSRVVVYRRVVNNDIQTSPEIVVPGTLLETVSVSPATYGFTLIAAQADISAPVAESRQRYQSGSTDAGPVFAIRDVDQWDIRVTTGYRLTFDGNLQVLTDRTDDIPRNSGNISGIRVVGSGADAAQFFTMTIARDFYDDVDDEDPGFFKSQQAGIWASWNVDTEQLSDIPINLLTNPISEMGYISNQRLVVETAVTDAFGVKTGDFNLQDFRTRDTGAVTLVNTEAMPPGGHILALNTFSRTGTPIFLYLVDNSRTTVGLFRFDTNLTKLGGDVNLPSRITSGNRFVRNPRDASLLILDDNSQALWIPSSLDPVTSQVLGLSTPQALPSAYDAGPLFVSSVEAVVWRNAGAPADIAGGGVVPVADISHYSLNTGGGLVTTPLAPPILGRYVSKVQSLSLEPDTEGWYVSTFEKTGARTTVLRTYRLQTPATFDTDGDGILDIYETNTGVFNGQFNTGTDPLLPDSDGDGVSDYAEIFVTLTDPTIKSFGEAPNPTDRVDYTSALVNGVYEGLVYSSDGFCFKQTLTLSSKGAFSSKLRGLLSDSSFRGQFDPTGRFAGPVTAQGVTSVQMSVVQDASSNYVVSGSYNTVSGGTFYFELARPLYSKGNPYIGRPQVTFEASLAEAVSGGPQGSIVATGTISTKGVIKFTIYMADGVKQTFSGPILEGDKIALFAKGSSRRGSSPVLLGSLKVQDIKEQSDFNGLVRLFSASAPSGTMFPSGYDQNRELLGSYFYPAAKGTLPLDTFLATDNNMVLRWLDGNFAGVNKVGTWATNAKVTIPQTQIDSAKVKYTGKTGLLTISYQRTDAGMSLFNATCKGHAVVQQKNSTLKGYYVSASSAGSLVVDPNSGGLEPDITFISPRKKTMPRAGGTYEVTVMAEGAWEVFVPPNMTWLTVVTKSGVVAGELTGTGNGRVLVTVAPGTDNLIKEGEITIAGLKHKVIRDYR